MKFKLLGQILVVLLIVSWIFGSCKNQHAEQNTLDKLHEEVMEIHDDVMPKMQVIYTLRKQLLDLNDDSVKPLIENLEAADEAMMSWMAQYKKPKIGEENFKEYLGHQKTLMTNVREQMLNAIREAENHLSS